MGGFLVEEFTVWSSRKGGNALSGIAKSADVCNDLPCLGSSGLSVFPRLVVSDHCAQDDDEFSHDGGDRDLEGLSLAGQPLGKVAEVSVRADCGHSGHVKAGADLAAPPANSSLSALLPAVAIIGG